MKAYKYWDETKHFIHKDTTNELNVTWTTNIEDALNIPHRGKALTFFFDVLGFSLNLSKPDPLYLY
jgi:hypothetical protein